MLTNEQPIRRLLPLGKILVLVIVSEFCTGCMAGAVPEGLRNTRIVLGESVLCRSIFFRQPSMGFVTQLEIMRRPNDEESALAVFDQRSLWIVDLKSSAIQHATNYKRTGYYSRPQLVDVMSDGVSEIMCRGGGFSDVALVDIQGELLWKKSGSYEFDFVALSMSGGDLDRDGEMEFYVAATDGLYCFDASGLQKWKEGNGFRYHHVEVLDTDMNSQPMIVSCGTDEGGQEFLEFRGPEGTLIRRLQTEVIGEFRVLEWPGQAEGVRILTRTGSAVLLLDENGDAVFRYNIPQVFRTGFGIEGVFVRFAESESLSLAVLLGTRARWRRTILSVFSLEGVLLYQEVLGASTGILATQLQDKDAAGETLLVGDGRGKVVAYKKLRSSP